MFLPCTHMLMTAIYIYIYNWPRETARALLCQSLDDLVEMGKAHGWATRCVKMVVNWALDQASFPAVYLLGLNLV
jgi:hypothetical protein